MTDPCPKWVVQRIAPNLIRLDTHEETLGDEWRGSVLLDDAEARRLATDLAMVVGRTKEKA